MHYCYRISANTIQILVLVICGTLTALAAGPEREAVEHYSKGLQLVKNRDFRNAAIAFEQSITVDPSYGDAHYALAKTYKTLNQFGRATIAFETAAAVGVSSARVQKQIPQQLTDVYTKSAVQSFKQKKFREAIANCEMALKHNSSNPQILYLLGLCYGGLRDQEAATNAFQKVIETDPSYVKAYTSLANVQRRQGKFRVATKTYRQAIALDSTQMTAYSGIGRIHLRNKNFEGARVILQKAVRIDPRFAEGFLLLGHTLNKTAKFHEAIEPLRHAVELDRGHAEAFYRLAQAYYGIGDWRKALDSSLDAVRKKHDYHAAQVVVADAYRELGQRREAKIWYNKAKEDNRFKDWCLHHLKELDRQP